MDAVNAGVYVRQSLDVAEGIERQRDRCRTLVDLRGWSLVDEYVDNDVSASKPRGPGTAWHRLIEDVRAGRIAVVVAVNLDRLLRTQRDLTTLIDAGAAVVTLEGELDLASASGEMQAAVLTAMARFEARRKGERQTRANEQRARAGKPLAGGRRAFGYGIDGCTLVEAEAAAIRWAYDAVVHGDSLASIAREWNGRGLRSTQLRQARSGHAGKPSPWRADSVRSVLRNPKNAGIVRYRGATLHGVEAEWPAVVSPAVFEAAQAVIDNPVRRTPGRSPVRLLTGVAACGVCGATVHGGGGRGGVPTYRCSAALGHFARRSEPIDEFVTAVVVGRLSMPDAASTLTRRPQGPDVDALAAEAVGIRERLDGLAVAFADGAVTAAQLRTGTDRMLARLAEIESALSDVDRSATLDGLLGGDAQAAWDRLSGDRRRAVIRLLMNVRILPVGRGVRTFDAASVEITWEAEA